MARDFIINGEVLVTVRGGLHTQLSATGDISSVSQLGLCSEAVRISPRFVHEDLHADDFGGSIPPEVMWNLADCRIDMTLCHYDKRVLDAVLTESMAGSAAGGFAGILAGAWTPMGGFNQPYASGCHYIGLGLSSPVIQFPWRFPTCYLAEPPLVLPIGTERSLAVLNWRAIPYTVPPLLVTIGTGGGQTSNEFGELRSSGALLWDHAVLT